MSNIDIKLKSYDELQFEVMTLTTNSYLKDLKIKELQNRIDKAIEYIEHYGNLYCLRHKQFKEYKQYEDLLDILKGGNNDIPGFEGTLEELDNLSIRGKDE
nr:hypothetical protein [bacterium]